MTTQQYARWRLFTQNSRAQVAYSRQELLDIRALNVDTFSDVLRLTPEIAKTSEASNPASPTRSARRRRRDRKQKRGKRGGLQAKLKLTPHQLSLPSIFLANVHSLTDKIDELRLRIISHNWIKDCNIMIFTETWLNSGVPDSAIELAERYVLRADRTADDSGKTRGGGLCIYVNKAWCTDTASIESHCSANLEFLMVKCRPFYLPREFTSTVVTATYVPPDANAKQAMKELHAAISKQQTLHPEAAFIVAGDFNHASLNTVLPKFHQNVSCPTKGDKTLHHVYTNMAEAYKATTLPHLGQSDHLSLFLFPKYTPLIGCVKPTVKVWPEGADSTLQQRFQNTDWSVCRSGHHGLTHGH